MKNVAIKTFNHLKLHEITKKALERFALRSENSHFIKSLAIFNRSQLYCYSDCLFSFDVVLRLLRDSFVLNRTKNSRHEKVAQEDASGRYQ